MINVDFPTPDEPINTTVCGCANKKCFNEAKKEKVCGLFPVIIDDEFHGVALAYKDNFVKFIKAEGFVTSNFILEHLNLLLCSSTICSMMDLKSHNI